jgi:hypothetical protein
MANAIQNGDFERDLHQWEVVPEYWSESSDPLVGTQQAPIKPKGQSLYIELARWVQVEQQYPWIIYAGESHLHFYGHWSGAWGSEQVVSAS